MLAEPMTVVDPVKDVFLAGDAERDQMVNVFRTIVKDHGNQPSWDVLWYTHII